MFLFYVVYKFHSFFFFTSEKVLRLKNEVIISFKYFLLE